MIRFNATHILYKIERILQSYICIYYGVFKKNRLLMQGVAVDNNNPLVFFIFNILLIMLFELLPMVPYANSASDNWIDVFTNINRASIAVFMEPFKYYIGTICFSLALTYGASRLGIRAVCNRLFENVNLTYTILQPLHTKETTISLCYASAWFLPIYLLCELNNYINIFFINEIIGYDFQDSKFYYLIILYRIFFDKNIVLIILLVPVALWLIANCIEYI